MRWAVDGCEPLLAGTEVDSQVTYHLGSLLDWGPWKHGYGTPSLNFVRRLKNEREKF